MAKEGVEKLAERVRRVDIRDTPLGVKPKKYIVEEVMMDGRKPENKSQSVSYDSVDGRTYRFRLRDSDGKMLPDRTTLAMFLCFREVEMGGLASVVMKAFGVTIDDLDSKQVFPILEPLPPAVTEPEEVENSDFTLGG
jgi:hypothetical protein